MAEWFCEHFDCACPPFVTDGRVSQREWADYVEAMDITWEEMATTKVRLVAGPPDEHDVQHSWHRTTNLDALPDFHPAKVVLGECCGHRVAHHIVQTLEGRPYVQCATCGPCSKMPVVR